MKGLHMYKTREMRKKAARKLRRLLRRENYARNTAILNETPKNHKPSKRTVVKK